MRYKFVIPTLYIFSTLSLFPDANNLSDTLQQTGEKNTHVTPVKDKNEKKKTKKKSRFIFKDTYKTKGIDSINENLQNRESKKYVYENKPRFKFKFTPGTEYSNIVGGQGTASANGGGSSAGGRIGGGGQGSGRH